jgi:hypothetical protein
MDRAQRESVLSEVAATHVDLAWSKRKRELTPGSFPL